MVTVLNPTTGAEEKRPLNEIASSHLARRTFIGNLYKKVKDPNLVGSLSGHKEGSKALARYRDIDEDMKKELVNLLDWILFSPALYISSVHRAYIVPELNHPYAICL